MGYNLVDKKFSPPLATTSGKEQAFKFNVVKEDNKGKKTAIEKLIPKKRIDDCIAALKEVGITNKYIICGILCCIGKESGFAPRDEVMSYSQAQLKSQTLEGKPANPFVSYFHGSTWPPVFSSRPRPEDYDTSNDKGQKLSNYVYTWEKSGGNWISSRIGNKWGTDDGWKYRGRGYNGITFRAQYENYGKKYTREGVPGPNISGLMDNPEKINEPVNAAKALAAYFIWGYKSFDSKIKRPAPNGYGKSWKDIDSWEDGVELACQQNGGMGNGRSSGPAWGKKGSPSVTRWATTNAIKYLDGFKSYLEGNPTAPPFEPTDPSNATNTASNQDTAQGAGGEPIAQQPQSSSNSGTNDSGGSSNSSSGSPITTVTQFFKPTIIPLAIQFDASPLPAQDREKISKQIGYAPSLFINNYQIKKTDIEKVKLYHKGIVPILEASFYDTLGLLSANGMPKDDSKITVFINSRSRNLRSIQMTFKIIDSKDTGKGLFNIVASCDIPELYIKKFTSYSSKTSHEALQEIAKQCGLGFCSNFQNSNDKMNWMNTGYRNLELIESIVSNSYVSEQSFQYCYIDYFYNLCFIDINKELLRDVSRDKMIDCFGARYLGEPEDTDTDDKVVSLILSTDKSARGSISFIEKYDLINKSTQVSLKTSYRTRTKYYDPMKKEILIFDVESQTSDGSKSIILKGDPNDKDFFNNNTSTVWAGKIDSFEEGQGNVHANYNYTKTQNKRNLADMSKFTAKLYLPNYNHNLYVYQKVPILFMLEKPNPANENTIVDRLTGDWLITDVEYNIIQGKQYQVLTAILKELTLGPDERSESQPSANKGDDAGKSHTNELAPGDQPAPEPSKTCDFPTNTFTFVSNAGENYIIKIDSVQGDSATATVTKDGKETKLQIQKSLKGSDCIITFKWQEGEVGTQSPKDVEGPLRTPGTNTTSTNQQKQDAYPTVESGDMQDSIPEAPENPTKSTPSGFPIKSTAYSKNSAKKTQVIIHYTAGWQVTDRNEATIRTLFERQQNNETPPKGLTYHYIIDVTGHVENLVPPEYKAYHGSSANNTSVGISLACLGSTSNIEGSSTYKNRKGAYRLIENYVDYCDINLQPKKWRGIQRGQEVSEKQLISLLKLLRYLRKRIPTLPAWNGLNEGNFSTVFGSGSEWKSDLPGYFTHGSVTSKKVDAAPTPRLVQFLKTNKW